MSYNITNDNPTSNEQHCAQKAGLPDQNDQIPRSKANPVNNTPDSEMSTEKDRSAAMKMGKKWASEKSKLELLNTYLRLGKGTRKIEDYLANLQRERHNGKLISEGTTKGLK